jgi:hypothetical protein
MGNEKFIQHLSGSLKGREHMVRRIKRDFTETGCEGVDQTEMVQVAFVNIVMSIRIP